MHTLLNASADFLLHLKLAAGDSQLATKRGEQTRIWRVAQKGKILIFVIVERGVIKMLYAQFS